jgi:hypothetical protein
VGAAADRDRSAFAQQRFSDGAPDAAIPAGDDCSFVVEEWMHDCDSKPR